MRYTTGPGNRLDLLVRRSKGDYLDPGTTPGALSDYSENGAELRGGLALSGNSRLDGRLAYTKRKNDTRRDLDFSSPQYDLTYTYRLSGATTLALAALRQRGTVGDQLLQNATATTFRFLPTVALSAKVNLRGTLEQTRRSLLADASAPAGSTRSERVRAYGFGASWAAQRWLLVDLDLRREQRSASVSGFDYDANVGALNLTARF